jgi:beta-glucosidase
MMKRREALQLLAAAPLPFIPADWPAAQPAPASYGFGPDFKFGFSTSAYQIEGAVREDGRSPGIWDKFCHTGHHIQQGHNADMACDHCHRMPEDVALVAQAGMKNTGSRCPGRGSTRN